MEKQKITVILLSMAVFFDAIILPGKGLVAVISFLLIVLVGIWVIKIRKNWFLMSFIYISAAAFFYFFSDGSLSGLAINKLSDWSLTFLLIGAIQSVRHD